MSSCLTVEPDRTCVYADGLAQTAVSKSWSRSDYATDTGRYDEAAVTAVPPRTAPP